MFLFRLKRTVKLGVKSLWMHRLRSTLTALGIIFGVSSVIAMLAIGEGASQETQLRLTSGHPIPADELEDELPTAPAGVLIGHDHVDVGILPIPHPVHERDLGAEEGPVAISVAVQEHPKGAVGLGRLARGLFRGRGRRLLSGQGRGPKGQEDEEQCYR